MVDLMKGKCRSLIVVSSAIAALFCNISGALELALPTESDPGPGPDHESRPFLDGPFPNFVLAKQVVAEFGKLTLFADHASADDHGVPLYVVNRGTKDVSWHTYAGDPGIVLERYDEASKSWQRAQAGMITFAMCGNSFVRLSLKPGQHFKILGYRPRRGSEGKVRFHLDAHNLTSNEGRGLWLETDAAKVGVDRMQLSDHPFANELEYWQLKGVNPQQKSIERVLAELALMQVWEDGPVFRIFAKAFKAELERHASEAGPANAEAIKVVDSLLAKQSVAQVNRDELFLRCIDILRSPRGRIYGSPEKEQEVAWSALAWLQGQDRIPQDGRWRTAYELLGPRLKGAGDSEQKEISRLIHGRTMAYEFLSRDFMIEAAQVYPILREACVERLAGCEDWAGLLKVADGLDLQGRLLVLHYFCLDLRSGDESRRLRTTYDEKEIEFWKACIREGPWSSVDAMGKALRTSEGYYLEPGLWLALWDQGKSFAEKARKQPWPDDDGKMRQGIRQYVRILGRDTTPKGNWTLHRLRELGEVRPDGESDEQNGRRQEIARDARHQLLLAGWDPEDNSSGE